MAFPVTIPNTFSNATSSIPLSQLDNNFTTLVTALNGVANGAETLSNVSITGGTLSNVTLDNVTVDVETLSNVTITNLTVNSSFTINSANVSTPNGLNFDSNTLVIDAANNYVGVGTDSPQAKVHILGLNQNFLTSRNSVPPSSSAGLGGYQFGGYSTGTTTVAAASIAGLAGGAWTSTSTPSQILFYTTPSGTTTASEAMRIDSSGNVGIGASAPAARLEIAGGNGGVTDPLLATTRLRFSDVDTTKANNQVTGGIEWYTADSDSAGVYAYISSATNSAGSGYVTFATGSSSTIAERMRIDSSGNLGLGVTPSAWDSTFKAIQVGARSMFFGTGTEANMANNAYYNSGYKYVATAAAGLYTIDANAHEWYIAPSGTAGNAISFTQAMTLDASGNLGVGTSSPSARLHSVTSSSTQALFARTGQNAQFKIYQGADDSYLSATNSGANLILATQDTERMRIASNGDVIIGSTVAPVGAGLAVNSGISSSSTTAIEIQQNTTGAVKAAAAFGVAIQNGGEATNAAELTFFTASGGSLGERMRISSSGNVLINTTAAVVDSTSRLAVSTTTASGVAAEFSNNTSGTCAVAINNSGAATSTLINWVAAGSYRAAVTWNGTNIIYGTPSDQRLKENIVDASSALPLINNIRIRSFDFKENGKHIDFGVIAQELVTVVPEAVLKGKDNEDGSIKESWSVDTSTLVPALVKAIQEQQAIIESLKSRLDAAGL